MGYQKSGGNYDQSPYIIGGKKYSKEIKSPIQTVTNKFAYDLSKLSILYQNIEIGRLSSASNYKTNDRGAQIINQDLVTSPSTNPGVARSSMPGISIKRVTSAYSSNTRHRAGRGMAAAIQKTNKDPI